MRQVYIHTSAMKNKKKNEMKQGCGHCLRYSENVKRSAPYDLGKEY